VYRSLIVGKHFRSNLIWKQKGKEMSLTQAQRVVRLYRQMVKSARDWVVDIEYWRQNALEIRYRFDQNAKITDKKTIERLITEGETLLAKYRHPNPYITPSGVDGTSWERDVPIPKDVVESGFGNFERDDSHDHHHGSHGHDNGSHGHGHATPQNHH